MNVPEFSVIFDYFITCLAKREKLLLLRNHYK